MKITLVSNAPGVASGYGQQSAYLVQRLIADGHDVAVAANFGLDGRILDEGGYRVYPRDSDQYGIGLAPFQHGHHMAPQRPDEGWMLALYDAWPLDSWGDEVFRTVPVAGWYPVDHLPVPPEVLPVARKTRLVIAMSRFGQEQFAAVGVPSRYVPHAIDTAVYSPTAKGGFRAGMGIPEDAFLVGIVAANIGSTPPRKGWGEMFFALGRFMRDHPEAWLYVHTNKAGIRGVPLHVLEVAAGIPAERVRYVDQVAYRMGMVTPEAMATMYASLDVHLLSSYGEGFGIPVVEAAACGTPSIVSDGTAQRELVGAGWTVAVEPFWDHNAGAWFHRPSIGSILRRLEESLADRGNQQRRAAARAFAEEYDVDLVHARYWRPVLAEMEASLAAPPPAAARAERRRAEKEARKAARHRPAV